MAIRRLRVSHTLSQTTNHSRCGSMPSLPEAAGPNGSQSRSVTILRAEKPRTCRSRRTVYVPTRLGPSPRLAETR